MTAASVYRRCRRAGIRLVAEGEVVRFDAPPSTSVPLADLRRCKPELLALLRGDYLRAAMELLLSAEADPERQLAIAERFDERVAVCQRDGRMPRGAAERVAYRELGAAMGGCRTRQVS